ncbi:hypothetical protein F9278_00760 [Streptomyces phaeolivaceus]|uniref:Uncharacterized protein n=1 Tax=Streptomyces phaeolivaceus TaxID=2653200 RepID=A0A5P8JX16_9ACTN|nr:hypothetical protein [Streptomyces phaeolivaceus]QFQ94967.1 hypothetical protein F9278_00760 [Streptomyces phaeolivaceus]
MADGREPGSVWWKTCGETPSDGPVRLGGEDLTAGDLGVVQWVIRRDDPADRRLDRARAGFDIVG